MRYFLTVTLLILSLAPAGADERRATLVLAITLPDGETRPIQAGLFSCDSVDCTEPQTFERNFFGPDGQPKKEVIAAVPITVPIQWDFKTYRGYDFVFWVEAPGYWSPRILVVADNAVFPLPLLRTGEITGTVPTPGPPGSISVEIQPPPEGDARSRVQIPCAVDPDGTFRCQIPGGRFEITVLQEGEAVLTHKEVTVIPGQTRVLPNAE